MGMIIIIDLLFIFLIIGIVIKVINIYVKTHDNIERIKEIRAEKRAKKNQYPEPHREYNDYPVERKDETDDWIYDRRTKSFIHKDEYFRQ